MSVKGGERQTFRIRLPALTYGTQSIREQRRGGMRPSANQKNSKAIGYVIGAGVVTLALMLFSGLSSSILPLFFEEVERPDLLGFWEILGISSAAFMSILSFRSLRKDRLPKNNRSDQNGWGQNSWENVTDMILSPEHRYTGRTDEIHRERFDEGSQRDDERISRFSYDEQRSERDEFARSPRVEANRTDGPQPTRLRLTPSLSIIPTRERSARGRNVEVETDDNETELATTPTGRTMTWRELCSRLTQEERIRLKTFMEDRLFHSRSASSLQKPDQRELERWEEDQHFPVE